MKWPLHTCMFVGVTLVAFTVQGCGESREASTQFSIEQLDPEVIRADQPAELTLTGAGLDKADWVGFGFSDDLADRKAIAAVSDIEVVSPGTIQVTPPALPGITERTEVWVTAGRGFEESQPVAVLYRPPYFVETHFSLIAGVVCISLAMMLMLFLLCAYRGRLRRLRRLDLVRSERQKRRERRHDRIVDEYLTRERQDQEREFLPYTEDQPTSKSNVER